MRRDRSSIVEYASDQSTDNPSRRQTVSNTASSSAASRSHSSTKPRRLTGTGSRRSGVDGGTKAGSYGSDGSQRTPSTFCTRRSVGSPLSSQATG